MEHKIAKNNLSPNILKITYKPDIYIESIATPKIVLHGMFRVGSSYVYQKIRQSLGNRGICFYEPFHERLLSYHKESHPPNTEDSSMHPRLSDSSSLFDSYDRLIENKVSSEAVPFYSKDMSYYDMTGTIEEINHKKLIYISNLYEFAKNQDVQSILQPNRTWLLSEKQLKYIFDAEETTVNHFYIYRSPYDQFMSMLTHAKKTGSPGFFRSLLIILYHASCRQVNMLDSSVSLLVDKMKSTIGEQEARQDLVKDTAHALLVPLNVETALDIYIETLKLHLVRFPFHMCTTIDINKVSSSLSYRRTIEYVLMRDYIYLDLDDCSIPTYPRGSSEWDAFCRKGGKRLDEEICQRLADSPLAVRPESNGMNTNVSNDWALVQNVSAESLTIQIARGTRLLLIPGSKRTVHKSSLKSLPNGVRIV